MVQCFGSIFCRLTASHAGMVELADTPDLGSGSLPSAGSSPVTRTNGGSKLRLEFVLRDIRSLRNRDIVFAIATLWRIHPFALNG